MEGFSSKEGSIEFDGRRFEYVIEIRRIRRDRKEVKYLERWRPPKMNGGEKMGVMRRWTTSFGKVHQERVTRSLWIQRVLQYNRSGWPRLHFPKSNPVYLTKKRCARISTVIKKKDIAQNLYDAYAAALIGYSTDDDDF
ncbi:hypothetical protein CEXT_5801 [Caerostris extrusa]|uniref:Uncharacterized protein n=1 Tax=Caerostris extrusa TaxID=172846 RepID=A0AAV4WR37_CAEEX|nr:hypothetical protein CEXT_5801 [Caerostris extrusa]